MISARYFRSVFRSSCATLLAVAAIAFCFSQAHAQPTILSTIPAMGASGVSPSANVVFTFSEPMDTTATTAEFLDVLNPLSPFPTTQAWSGGNTVLTCTPSPAFPSNKQIYWAVNGQNPGGDSLGGTPAGFFTTGTGGGGSTNLGTNRVTTFVIAKVYSYEQDSVGVPAVDTNEPPYLFEASTSLASNRTATAITLTLPANGGTSNLIQYSAQYAPNDYLLLYSAPSSNNLETTFPSGNYSITVTATASNQTVSIPLASVSSQPNTPHVSNYAEAQSVNASQPFTLKWDTFAGGTSSDYISVAISAQDEVWNSGDFGATNALKGTATSVTIPAGTLAANTPYRVDLGFYRPTWTSNATYVSGSFRASVTHFDLTTVGTSAPLPVVSNPAWAGTSFGFDVATSAGQQLTVVSTTDVSQPLSTWPVLFTTNSPGLKVHISDPTAASKPARFYAVRNGP